MRILGTSSDGPWGVEGHSSDCRTEGSPRRMAAWQVGGQEIMRNLRESGQGTW